MIEKERVTAWLPTVARSDPMRRFPLLVAGSSQRQLALPLANPADVGRNNRLPNRSAHLTDPVRSSARTDHALIVLRSSGERGRTRSAERDVPTPLSTRSTRRHLFRPFERTPGAAERGFDMRDLPDRPSLEYYRREAKELVRAHRAGDAKARTRAAAFLGDREPFRLADAQRLLAREHGHRSWTELRRVIEATPLAALADVERGEIVVDSGLAYGDGEPVRILVRKRLYRYLLTDHGRAVAKAGKPPGWQEPAEWAAEPMNVDRSGNVFVPAVEGRDLADLLVRLADASRAVHEALLALDE